MRSDNYPQDKTNPAHVSVRKKAILAAVIARNEAIPADNKSKTNANQFGFPDPC